MRVFWPTNCFEGLDPNAKSIILGWQNQNDNFVVVTALPYLDVDLASKLLENDAIFGSQRQIKSAYQLYKKFNHQKLQVLGTVNHTQDGALLIASKDKCTTSDNKPCRLIYFDTPNPNRMHYYTLKSAEFYNVPFKNTEHVELEPTLDYHLGPQKDLDFGLDQCISQINCVHDLQSILRTNSEEIFPNLIREPDLIFTAYAAKTLPNRELNESKEILKPGCIPTSMFIFITNFFGFILHAIDLPLLYGRTIKSFSSFFQQIEAKLNMIAYCYLEYTNVWQRDQQGWHWLTATRNEAYIRVYNCLILEFNDWWLGMCFSYFIYTQKEYIQESLPSLVSQYLGTKFELTTMWLMSWPGGFKLNTQLAQFLGDMILWVIDVWRVFSELLLRNYVLQPVLHLMAFVGCIGGFSMQAAVIVDLYSVFTLHLYVFYLVFSRLYNLPLHVLAALFRVFSGRKFNFLRQRVDQADYDTNELLLGTILFTVALFLIPTFFAFYSVFALTRLLVLAVVTGVGLCITTINHFPLFPLILKLKSPSRIPRGVKFSYSQKEDVLKLETQPMEFGEILEQYKCSASVLRIGIWEAGLVRKLLTGKAVKGHQGRVYAALYAVTPKQMQRLNMLKQELLDHR